MRRPAPLQGILVLAAFQAVRHTALTLVHFLTAREVSVSEKPVVGGRRCLVRLTVAAACAQWTSCQKAFARCRTAAASSSHTAKEARDTPVQAGCNLKAGWLCQSTHFRVCARLSEHAG